MRGKTVMLFVWKLSFWSSNISRFFFEKQKSCVPDSISNLPEIYHQNSVTNVPSPTSSYFLLIVISKSTTQRQLTRRLESANNWSVFQPPQKSFFSFDLKREKATIEGEMKGDWWFVKREFDEHFGIPLFSGNNHRPL